MKKIIKSFFFSFFIAYILFGIFLYIAQNNFLYFPTPKTYNNYQQKIFINQDEYIHTTILNIGNKKAIIYFGGNGEDVDNNVKNFTKIFKSYTVYLVKYRGYGNSTGEPTEKNLYSDAMFIYDSIKSEYKDISIIGRSLGSGIATFIASKKDIEKLALITPFDSIENIAQTQIPFYPMSILLKDKYDSISRVTFIKSTTLILTAQYDKIIPKKNSDNLENKFLPLQLTAKVINKEDHNSISYNKKYYILLKDFFKI